MRRTTSNGSRLSSSLHLDLGSATVLPRARLLGKDMRRYGWVLVYVARRGGQDGGGRRRAWESGRVRGIVETRLLRHLWLHWEWMGVSGVNTLSVAWTPANVAESGRWRCGGATAFETEPRRKANDDCSSHNSTNNTPSYSSSI